MNNIRIITPPSIIEQSKIAQISNREALAKNRLETKIAKEIARRYTAQQQNDPFSENNIGGQLEFSRKQKYKIRTKKRFLKRGFFLKPDSGYDAQNRLRFRTRESLNTLSEPEEYPFVIDNGILKPDRANIATDNNLIVGEEFGNLTYVTGSSSESLDSWTIEGFLYLESGPTLPGTINQIDQSTYRISEVMSYINLYLRFESDTNPSSSISRFFNFTKHRVVTLTDGPAVDAIAEATLNWSMVATSYAFAGVDPLRPLGFVVGLGGRNYHFAITRTKDETRAYIDGIPFLPLKYYDTNRDLHPLVFPPIAAGTNIIVGLSAGRNYYYRIKNMYTGETLSYLPYEVAPANCGWSQVRFTPGIALYSSESFTPPTAISDLF